MDIVELFARFHEKFFPDNPTLGHLFIIGLGVIGVGCILFFLSSWGADRYAERRHTPSVGPSPPAVSIPPIRTPQSGQPTPQQSLPKRELNLIFKDSPLFTADRREKLADQLEEFYLYLVALGLDPPKDVPSIAVYQGKGSSGPSGWLGASPYSQSIGIGDQSMDDPDAIRQAYAAHAFVAILGGYKSSYMTLVHRQMYSFALGPYFVHSFSGTAPTNLGDWVPGKWLGAFWEMREKFGKDFTDESLAYMCKMVDDQMFGPQNDNSNKDVSNEKINGEFFVRFFYAEAVADNDRSKWEKILKEIIRPRGLAPPQWQPGV